MPVLLDDDFEHGLAAVGAAAPWEIRPTCAGPLGDGVLRHSAAGLEVEPAAVDPGTGTPAFTRTGDPEPPTAFIRWMAVVRPGAERPDFPADGVPLHGTAELSVSVFRSPTHSADADDSRDDLRYAAGGLCAFDRPSGLVFDIALGERWVHAVYERLPKPGSGHRAFSYAVPVAEVRPGDFHRCAIVYDRAAGAVSWIVDGRPVLRVAELGRTTLAEEHLLWEIPGESAPVVPEGLGFGLATMAGAALGQGAALRVRRFTVATDAVR